MNDCNSHFTAKCSPILVNVACGAIGKLIREYPALDKKYKNQLGSFILSFLSTTNYVKAKKDLLVELAASLTVMHAILD